MKLQYQTSSKRASIYTRDGSYVKGLEKVEVANVGELVDILQQLPRDLPIEGKNTTGPGCLVWFNIGQEDEHLSLDDHGTWGDE